MITGIVISAADESMIYGPDQHLWLDLLNSITKARALLRTKPVS